LLILDEPTNHLDMQSKEMLKQALLKYNGTLILVSHDRYFLDGLTDEIFEFHDKKIKKHEGDINLFLKKKRAENFKLYEKVEKNDNSIKELNPVTDNKELYLKRKEADKEIRKYTKRFTEVEKQIEKLETYISATEKKLSSGEEINDPNLFSEFEKANKTLEENLNEWEKLTDIITDLKDKKSQIK